MPRALSVPTASLKLISVIAPSSLHLKFSIVSYQMQTISADSHSWERKVGPLFLSFPSRPLLPLPLLPFPTVAISDLLTPSWRYGQRSLKCQQSSSLFPTVSPEGQTSSCGKEPSAPWHRVTALVRNAQRKVQNWGGHGYTAPAVVTLTQGYLECSDLGAPQPG